MRTHAAAVPGFALAILLVLSGSPLQALQQGPVLTSSAVSVNVGGRVQTQFNTSDVEGKPDTEMIMRRARIELSVQIDDRISGAIQPDFGEDEVELKDTYLMVALSSGVNLLFGKAYRPFGLLEQTSSKRILPIERGLRIRGLRASDEYAFLSGLEYTDRDIGIQVRGAPTGAPLGLEYGFGLLRGPLHGQAGDEDSYQLAGRVTIEPIEALRLGAGWSTRDFLESDPTGSSTVRGHAFEIDAELGGFAPGFHLLAELSRADIDPATGASFWGAHSWLAYRTSQLADLRVQLEPVLRLSLASTDNTDPDLHHSGGVLLTPGLTLYFTPLNRLMINYDVWHGEDQSPDSRSFKAMFQLGF